MSNGERHYLDHNATTPLRAEARAAMLEAMELCGSASSVHREGRAARGLIERGRQSVADLVGAGTAGIIFTSGATEANNLALGGGWTKRSASERIDRCIVSTIEHTSVLHGVRLAPDCIERLPVDATGRADLAIWLPRIAAMAGEGDHPLVSLMLANNETGVLQPVGDVARAVRASGGVMHCDAAQAVGKIPVDCRALDVDLLTLSAHKLGGPGGMGAVVASDRIHLADPLILGGGQEKGQRGGTENIVAIAGFGAAADAARRDLVTEFARQLALREQIEAGLRAISPNVTIFGEDVERLPNTVCFSVPGLPAETAMIALDLRGIAVSSGSACSSGKVKASHVLIAMGASRDLVASALRVSVGRTTTKGDVEGLLSAWKGIRDGVDVARRVRAA